MFYLSIFSKNNIEIKNGENLKILKNIIENNKDIDFATKSISGMTSLICASMLGESEFVKIFFNKLKIDLDVMNAVDTNGMAALDYACTKNHIEIARILIDSANFNNISKGGVTTLMLVAAFSSKSIVKCLIYNSAIIN